MNLKQIVLALSVTSLAAAAFADDAHHADEKAQAAPSKPAAKQPAETMDMGAMHANMKRMHEQMAQIRSASDPKERARLVDEHMKTMQSMSTMHCEMMEHDAAEHATPR